MMNSDGSSSDYGPDIPAGVLRSRGGWADEDNLEVEHQRETMRAAGTGDGDHDETRGDARSGHAAVDLSQFRNEEVGKGYQAKHVVRQRELKPTTKGVVDMSGGKFRKKDKEGNKSSSGKRSRHEFSSEESDDRKRSQSEDPRLDSYLKCKGMRDFMKEIEAMLKQR
ncbi:hypothetical protein ACHAWF_009085 [Thalassiosira exigua]